MTGVAAAAFAAGVGMSASVSPAEVTGAYRGTSAVAQNITTGSTVASQSGGVSPYTYAWALSGTSAYTWTIGAATSATTGFTAQSVGAGQVAMATFEVTITDAGGATARALVNATASNESTA